MRLLPLLSLAGMLTTAAQGVIPAPQHISGNPAEPLPALPQVEGAYTLRYSAQKGEWEVNARDAAGRRYAQLTAAALVRENGGTPPPYVAVCDYPRHAWRGLHLDVSRHFFPPEVVREYIDRMAELKLNRLHLHLTDGPGWRIEIKKYPRLTEFAAWRKDLGVEDWEWPSIKIGPNHPKVEGGFYTQDQMRELVQYARGRGIMIVPEIDMPGHSYAAIAAYPEIGRADFPQMGLRGGDVLDVTNPRSLEFAKDVLTELMQLFPVDTPLHLGGDEVLPQFATREQQRDWMQRLVDFCREHGREAIVWDEAATNGVQRQTTMVWHASGTETLFHSGAPLILCPCSHFYFDYRPTEDDPGSVPAVITLQKVFEYTVPQGNIRGIQANLWTEHITTPQRLFHMAFPRAAALSERAWGSPKRPFADFQKDLRLLYPDK